MNFVLFFYAIVCIHWLPPLIVLKPEIGARCKEDVEIRREERRMKIEDGFFFFCHRRLMSDIIIITSYVTLCFLDGFATGQTSGVIDSPFLVGR